MKIDIYQSSLGWFWRVTIPGSGAYAVLHQRGYSPSEKECREHATEHVESVRYMVRKVSDKIEFAEPAMVAGDGA